MTEQLERQYQRYITLWQAGLVPGTRGIKLKALSKHVERYIKAKYGNKCSICSWNEVNPSTGTVPVEVDHIDGNHLNNAESNLRLLCPNCHSLTPTFRNLNRGNGRSQRRQLWIY